MFGFKKKQQHPFVSYGSGKLVALEDVNDKVFSTKMLGDGFAIEVEDGKIVAPVSGEITMAFPTGHAYGLTSEDKEEILLHLGIDTVELNGEGFKSKVRQGQKINQGEVLAEMDLDYIHRANKDSVCICIFTSGEKVEVGNLGENVTVGEPINLTLTK